MSDEQTLDELVADQKKDQRQNNKNNNKKGGKIMNKNRGNNNNRNNNNNNNRRGGAPNFRNNNNNNNNRRNNNNFNNNNNNNNNGFRNKFNNNNNNNFRGNNNGPRTIRRPTYQQQPRTIVKAIPVYPEPKREYDPFKDGVVMEIHNLFPKIQEEELYNLVTRYGAIKGCKIERDDKGRSCEKATVVFKDKLSAEEAKKDLHRCELEGRTISVDIISTRDRSFSPSRGVAVREPIQRRQGFKSQGNQRNNFFGRADRSGW